MMFAGFGDAIRIVELLNMKSPLRPSTEMVKKRLNDNMHRSIVLARAGEDWAFA